MSAAQRGGAKARQKLITRGESHGVVVWQIMTVKHVVTGVVRIGGRRLPVQHVRANIWRIAP